MRRRYLYDVFLKWGKWIISFQTLFFTTSIFAEIPTHSTSLTRDLSSHYFSQNAMSDRAAQEQIREQQRERALRQQQEKSSDIRLEREKIALKEKIPRNEKPCFFINDIELVGENANRFQWALKGINKDDDVINYCLGTEGINIVMKRIENKIIEKGFVTTRVLVADQNLKSGLLTFTVVPGRIRTVRFSEESHPRATKWNTVPISNGDILNIRHIEQALENYKRLPTSDADIQITPAQGPDIKPGESDLIISWKQKFPFRINLSIDDSGSQYTGKYQGAITISHDNLFGLNDLIYASFSHDLGGGYPGKKGSRGYTIHYQVPYHYWLFSFTTSQYNYHQSVPGINQTYSYSGTSQNNELRATLTIYRDASRKTALYLRGWTRTSNNFIDDTEIEIQRRQMAGWEAGINHREFIGSAVLDINTGYRQGTGAMKAMPAPEEAFGEGTSRPTIITTDTQFNLPFSIAKQRFRYSTALRVQFNRTPLIPQDRFSLGGRYSIRGFDGERTLIGDRGWFIRNDFSMALGTTGQEFYIGLDYGEVSGPSTQFILGKHLAGAAIGLRGGYKGFYWDVFVGKPISKPNGFKTAKTTFGFNLNFSY